MRYLVLRKQQGEGCDYSIGCGMVYEFVEMEGTQEEAISRIQHDVIYPDGEDEETSLDGDTPLKEAWIIPADNAIKIDLKAIKKEISDKEREARKREQDAKEKKEYEKLKAKFGQ